MAVGARVCLTVAAIAVAAPASGCQRKKKNEPERRAVEIKKPPPPVSILDEVVIGRGAKPHRLLRYKRSPTPRRFLRTVSATVSEIRDRKKQDPVKLPSVRTGFSLSWTETGLAVSIETPEIGQGKSAAIAYAREQTARFAGLLSGKNAVVELSDRGVMGAIGGLDTAQAGRRELAASLVDSIVVLPDVPVGVGAKWRVVRAVPRAQTVVKQRANYELLSIDGDRIGVAVSLVNIGERQTIGLPAPDGATSELLALKVTQSGEVSIDLSLPVPTAGSLERGDTIHIRATKQQKTVRDYFAESRATVVFETQKVARPKPGVQRQP